VATSRLIELDELAHSSAALPELVEAAVRADQPERAAAALDVLESRADERHPVGARDGSALARPGQQRTERRGPLPRGDRAAGQLPLATHLARAHLIYGEWLHRQGRRQDARSPLRTAHRQLSDMGAEAFAGRAARELRATGEHPRERSAQPTDVLPAHEAHIARLVATGATSREVASQLLLSPRTVEAHLRSIFRKLGITSRRQLRELRLP
jgi:DNA-binding CsgD family transcriptional regulator